MSQKVKVLRHLSSGHKITPIKALHEYGCMRLAAVIHQLRSEGYVIDTHMKSAFSGAKYAEYELKGHVGQEGGCRFA